MSASLSVMASEDAEPIPLCQPIIFRDTSDLNADRIPHMTETMQARIEKLLTDRGISIAEAERKSGLNKDTLRKLLRNPDQMPNTRTLSAIAAGLGVTQAWLLTGGGDQVDAEAAQQTSPMNGPNGDRIFAPPLPQRQEMPNDVPVYGTAAGSHLRGAFQFEGGVIDYVRRPPALMGARDIYALFVEGTSMEPQFHPGDLIYVHPHKPPRLGDAIVVQSHGDANQPKEATLGVYVRRTEKHIVISKHNPKAEIQILRNAETVIHKVLTLNELFGV